MIETNKVYCMDAFELLKQLPDKSVDLILTDPPYNTTKIEWDSFNPETYLDIFFQKIKDNGCVLIFGDIKQVGKILNHKFGRYEWVWIKTKAPNFLFGSKQPMRKTEYMAVLYKKQPTYNFVRIPKRNNYKTNTYLNKQYSTDTHNKITNNKLELKKKENYDHTTIYCENIIEISNFKKKSNWYKHPTEKPLKLIEFFIELYSNKGDLVLDCFVGSGTTAVACKRLNRNFICCDNNADYVAIANKRLAQQSVTDFTSATPTLAEPKEFNMGLKVPTSSPPKLSPTEITSPNSNIKLNRGICS